MWEINSEKFFLPRLARLRAGLGAKSLNVFSDCISTVVVAGDLTEPSGGELTKTVTGGTDLILAARISTMGSVIII